MRYLFALFILLGCCHTLYAQDDAAHDEEESETTLPAVADPQTITPTKSYQREKLEVKKFDQQKWKKVIGNTDYNDQGKDKKRNQQNSGESSDGDGSVRANAREEEEEEESPSFQLSVPWGGGMLAQLIFYGIIIAVIALLVVVIVNNIKWTPKVKKADNTGDGLASSVDDIESLDIDALLAKAQASGDYKTAIRIYFLGLLQKLNAGGLIIWKKDKTNREYLTELYARVHYINTIRDLTLAYEQAWYGDHMITRESFEALQLEFNSVNQLINTTLTSDEK